MTGQQTHTANAQQSYTLASRTSQRTDQSLPKSMPAPTQEKIQNIFSSPLKKIKTPDTTKTVKLNKDNGLQTRTTEHQLPTAVLQKWRFSASYDSLVGNQTLRHKHEGLLAFNKGIKYFSHII